MEVTESFSGSYAKNRLYPLSRAEPVT